MGIFSEIKRLLWVKKAVAESAAEKAAEKGREWGEEFAHKAKDTWNRGSDSTEEPTEKLTARPRNENVETRSTASDNVTKSEDWTQRSFSDRADDTESTAHRVGDRLGETAEKIGDAAEKTWDKAREEGKELLDKAVKTSDKVWEKAEDVGEDIFAKAKELAGKAGEKLYEGVDSLLEKAKALDKTIEEETDKIDPNRDGWADKPISEKLREHGSELKGKDDFFERADRYAEGDYSMGKPVVIKSDGDEDNTEGMTPLPPLPKEDIADDAIIDDEDDPDKT